MIRHILFHTAKVSSIKIHENIKMENQHYNFPTEISNLLKYKFDL